MIEEFILKKKIAIKSIEIKTDDDADSNSHGAYRIVLKTDIGDISFVGDHDSGPDIGGIAIGELD